MTKNCIIYDVEISKGAPIKDFLVIEMRELINKINEPFNLEESIKNLFLVICSIGS